MEVASHFFSDCLELEDGNPYPGSINIDEGNGPYELPHPLKEEIDWKPTFPQSAILKPLYSEDDHLVFGSDKPGLDLFQLSVDPSLLPGQQETVESPISHSDMSSVTSKSDTSSHQTSRNKSKSQKKTIVSTDTKQPGPRPTTRQPEKGRTKKPKGKATTASAEDEKRSRFLERNRVAASKCREKKKLYVSDLEETKRDLETQNAQLQLEYEGLLGEVSGLKNHLLAHAKCNDPNIEAWLSYEARKFVQNTSNVFGYSDRDLVESGIDGHPRDQSPVPSKKSLGIISIEAANNSESMMPS
jgi:cyclic AMP-dependent transcription factor ATF-2